MKVSFIAYTLLAVACVDAAPKLIKANEYCGEVGQPCTKLKRAPEPAPKLRKANEYCGEVGQSCTKFRRAAEAAAEALAAPKLKMANEYCGEVGQPCTKARRDALALAESMANAYNAVDHTADSCYATNGACNIAKRAEIEAAESQFVGNDDLDDDELEKRSDGKALCCP